jgi:hypothetical protein
VSHLDLGLLEDGRAAGRPKDDDDWGHGCVWGCGGVGLVVAESGNLVGTVLHRSPRPPACDCTHSCCRPSAMPPAPCASLLISQRASARMLCS